MIGMLDQKRFTLVICGCITTAMVSWGGVASAVEQRGKPRLTYHTASTAKARPRAGAAAYNAAVTARPQDSTCNDGVLDAGEDCDPLELFERLGVPSEQAVCCTAECKFASSGTICRPAARACDKPESCTAKSAFCPAEQLDDCCPGACGDQIVDAGEACDDGNATNGDGCDNCGLCTPVLQAETVPTRVLDFIEAQCPTCPEPARNQYDNHGSYVSCVVHTAVELRRRGELNGAVMSRLVNAASRSEVGHQSPRGHSMR